MSSPRILIFAPASRGGIADYTHHQANAMEAVGAEVTVLCTPRYLTGRGERYRCVPRLREYAQAKPSPSRVRRGVHFVYAILYNFSVLSRFAREGGYHAVLLDSYFEYMAPLWAWRMRRLSREGVVIGANVHDPVRNYIVGPRWWHRFSMGEGYSFLREAFVHHPIELDTGRAFPGLRTTVVPQGMYESAMPKLSRAAARASLGVPASARMALLFGSIRDNKNLDLVLRALEEVPDWHVVVAGHIISGSDRPVSFYEALAEELGVANRCHWRIGFIPADEVGDLFVAADLALLTYGAHFHSASAVLNTAAWYRVPCLASSGEGALREAVRRYDLGVWVPANSTSAIAEGFRSFVTNPPTPRWNEYSLEHSWLRNAERVLDAMTARAAVRAHVTGAKSV